MTRRERILYFYVAPSSFVKKDIAILEESFEVEKRLISIRTKWRIPFVLLGQFFFLLFTRKRGVVAVTQFAGFHSLVPALFSRISGLRSVIVLGGTDCVSFPSIGYGNFSRKLLGAFTAASMKWSDLLLPVDETLVHYRYTYQPNDGDAQGYLAHRPHIKTRHQVIYNGYDAAAWTFGDAVREPGSFVTIGAGLSGKYATLKGIDLIVEAARQRPQYTFYIVGGAGLPIENAPENLILNGLIPNEQLNAYLHTKESYLQLSLSEGFPNALCEAMLSGCIPVVSAVGAMPKIIGENGFILEHKSIAGLLVLLDELQALSESGKKQLAAAARSRIADHFPEENRKIQLTDAIRGLPG